MIYPSNIKEGSWDQVKWWEAVCMPLNPRISISRYRIIYSIVQCISDRWRCIMFFFVLYMEVATGTCPTIKEIENYRRTVIIFLYKIWLTITTRMAVSIVSSNPHEVILCVIHTQAIVLSVDIPCLYFMYVCKVSSDTRYVV